MPSSHTYHLDYASFLSAFYAAVTQIHLFI